MFAALVVLGLAWVLRPGGDDVDVVRAAPTDAARPGAPEGGTQLAGPPAAAGPTPSPRRVAETVAETEVQGAVPDDGRPRPVPPSTPGATVIRARLTDAGGEPRSLAGVPIELQAWLAEDSRTFRYGVETDADGVATFAFDGFVHVDWFKHEPRAGGALPFLYDEHHEDVQAGEHFETALRVLPGGSVVGRVVDPTGAPVGGVQVHVFQEYYRGDLVDTWRPGIAQVVSGADGIFRFPSLAATYWQLAVPPFEHVQLDPPLDDGRDGTSDFDLEAGATHDVGTLVVAPLARLEVELVDRTGAPASEALLAAAPVRLDVPGLRAPDGSLDDQVEGWLRGDEARSAGEGAHVLWSYRPTASFDEAGLATALLVPGTWKLRVRSQHHVAWSEGVERTVEVGAGTTAVEIVAPARLRNVRGRVVDHAGTPVPGVLVLVSSDVDGPGELRARSDWGGAFEVRAVPADARLWVRLQGEAVLPAVYLLEPEAARDEAAVTTYRVRRGALLRARVSILGERHVGFRFRLAPHSLAPLHPAPTPAEEDHRAELEESGGRDVRLRRDGAILEPGLWPGTWALEVLVPVGTGEFELHSSAPVLRYEPWQVFHLTTGDTLHEVEVDLRGYEPPVRRVEVQWGGRVRDAASGLALSGAELRLSGADWQRVIRTTSDGGFQVASPDTPLHVSVLREGYFELVRELPRPGALGPEVALELTPAHTQVEVRVATADGGELPPALLRWTGAAGDPVQAWVEGSGWTATAEVSPERTCVLRALPPGTYSLELELARQTLGAGELVVEDTAGPQRRTVTLPWTTAALRAHLLEARR